MNYQQSQIIWDKVNSAKNILINSHSRPDIDSMSSAFALYQVLTNIGKSVMVVCPDDPLIELSFLPGFNSFNKIDFKTFDFLKFNLFILLDSASPEVVTGSKEISLPLIETIVIDHHATNPNFASINLIDPNRSATAELLYLILSDWGITIDKQIATCLLSGILGDTGAFEYHNTTPQTLRIAADLMAAGADKDEILLKIFRTKSLSLLRFWGEVLAKIAIDQSGKFTWCAIPYKDYEALGKPPSSRESASSLFSRMIEGTDFGIVILEEEPRVIKVSLRSRGDFDVSKIAVELGGGGHKGASGVTITNLPFDKAVESVLVTARKHAAQ